MVLEAEHDEQGTSLNAAELMASGLTLHAVRRGVAAGAAFMVILRLSFRLIGFVNTLILVRILVPADFGLVGLVTAAYGILDYLSHMSLQLAIIRMPQPTRADYDTAWTLGVLRGAVIALLLALSAPFLAQYIHEPRMVQLTYIVALISFLQGFENIGLVDLQREFRFDRIFLYQLIGRVAGVVTAIAVALWLRNYWALMAGMAATRIMTLIMGYVVRPYRPRISFQSWNHLFHFSKWLVVGNALFVIDGNTVTFVIGRIAGATALGLYQVANQIGALPSSEIIAPIRDPVYAGAARLAEDLAQLKRYFLDNLELIVAVISPLSLGMFLLAEPIAAIFLGAKWIATVPLIRYCALWGLFEAISSYPAGIYAILNRQRDYSIILALQLVVHVPAIIIGGTYGGPAGAALALAASSALNMILCYTFLPRSLATGLRDFVRHIWRTAVASIAMVIAVGGALAIYREPVQPALGLLRLCTMVAVGGVVQLATQFALWAFAGRPDGAERVAIAAISRLLTRVAVSAGTRPQSAK